MRFKPAEETTRLDDQNSFGPWMHYAVVVQSVGDIGNSLIVNAHKYNYVPVADMAEKVEEAKAQLDQLLESYRRAYVTETPKAH